MGGAGETWPAAGRPGWTVNVSAPDGSPGSVAHLDALDDLGLVRACLDGQPEAFDLIVRRHQRAVYRLCYRFAGNAEDASDLSQEVFLRAYRAIGTFRGASSLATWLYRIGVNLCLNKATGRTPRPEPLDERDVTPERGPDAMGQLLAEERARRVRAAIAKLPDRQRATLILRVYQELSHQQIAEVLGSTEGAVKASFFHALRNLRNLLDEGTR